jgi:prepilin-type N-terminal cleavage/methylation domain-containing protein
VLISEPDESGFTLVELVVAMSVLLLVIGALLSGLESMTRAERTTSGRIDDEQALRLTLAQLTRDGRDAEQIQAEPTTAAYSTTMDLVVGGSHVRWAFAAGALTRSIVADDGTARATSVLAGVTASAFSWVGPGGQQLPSEPWATPADIARCTAELGATVTLVARVGAASVTQHAQTAVRNQAPSGGCR